MKIILILVAWTVATLAIPLAQFGDHQPDNFGGNIAAGQSDGAFPGPQQNNGGDNQDNRHHGDHDGHRGGNRGSNSASTAPPAQTAVNPPASGTAPAESSQATAAAADSGQGANNGQDSSNGQNSGSGAIDANFVPDFGQQAGVSPTGTGSCESNSGKLIPCSCPPSRSAFIQKLEQFVSAGSFPGGGSAPFPTGNTNQDALTRIDTIISTLQNFDGSPGKGCPAVSAPNFGVVQKRILGGALS